MAASPDRPPQLDGYFCLRDFEYAQPLYDLAFLLKIIAGVNSSKAPTYRTLSLNRAAHNFDSYASSVDDWISGGSADDLDDVPSARIRKYLQSIRGSGTIEELNELASDHAQSCLRLRSIRGLGPKLIQRFYQGGDRPSSEVLAEASRRSGLTEDMILAAWSGQAYGRWQAAHIVPPMLRFMRGLDDATSTPLNWGITGIKDGLSTVDDQFTVFTSAASTEIGPKVINSVLKSEPLFSLRPNSGGEVVLQHQMGWHFRLVSTSAGKRGFALERLVRALDPLAADLPSSIKSDLHVHTSWSDGLATPAAMATGAAANGLSYIAITDHSRSSKIQGGLAPWAWLRQAIALADARLECRVLHGLEVDILPDGQLDMPTGILQGMDFVVGSVHSAWGRSKDENTDRLVRAIESGMIDVLGHPTGAMIGRPGEPSYVRPPADVDWDVVFERCAKWRVAVEVNCFPSRLDLSGELLARAVDAGCSVAIGTDAHSRHHQNLLKFGAEIIRRAGQPQVLNHLSFDEMRQWLMEARQHREARPKTRSGLGQAQLFKGGSWHPQGRSPLAAYPSRRPWLPEGRDVVGLDLTAGKNRKTGVARLSGTRVETLSLGTDGDLLAYIKEVRPAIVSIDSPLGLPGGGDRINPRAGIVRVAEQDLASVGIHAYPALIDSMKELTLRGIRLRKQIEAMDNPPEVIESYPGAAQDLLCIPRKQRGLGLLRAGLDSLGLSGSGLATKSHDEMDAITSAVVGRYYDADQYEAMGVEAEAQLIVPRVQTLRFEVNPVLCIAGKTGAGKSVVSRYLSLYYGIRWIKTRDIICGLIRDDFDGIASQRLRVMDRQAPTEEDQIKFGRIIIEEYDQAPLRQRLSESVKTSDGAVVVDSVRTMNDLDRFALKDRVILICYIECSDEIIRQRLVGRNGKNLRDISDYEPIDQCSLILYPNAFTLLKNIGSLQQFHFLADDMMFAHLSELLGSNLRCTNDG